MSTAINYYRQWLNLRGERPKTHYHLLGIPLLERDQAKIKQAAAKTRAKIEQQRGKGHDAAVERLLEEVKQAEALLLNADRKAKYDQKIREKLAAQEKQSGAAGSASKQARPAGAASKTAAGKSPSAASPIDEDDDDDLMDLLPPGADDDSDDLPAPLTPGHFPTTAVPPAADYGAYPPAAVPVPPPAAPAGQWNAAGYAQEPVGPDVVPRAMPVASVTPVTPVTPVAAVPVATVTPVTPVTPVAPVPGGPVVSTSRVIRRRRRPPTGLLVCGGIGVLAVLVGALLFVTQSGPFAPQPKPQVAQRTSAAPKPAKPAGSSGKITMRGPATVPSDTYRSPSEVDLIPSTAPIAAEALEMASPGGNASMQATPQMESDPAAEAAVDHALMSVRYYLARRDFDQADLQLAAAEAAATKAPNKKADVQRVQSLAQYVKQFWDAVRAAVQSLESGDQVTIAGITVGVVEVQPDGVVLRQNGQNITHKYRDMRTGLAVGLAERSLQKGDAATELVMGAFKAINPTSNRDEARTHWQTAQQLGAEDQVTELLPELAVVIPDNFAPGKPTMVAGTPSPQPQPRPRPAQRPANRLPMPSATELNKLIAELKASRQQEFTSARSAEQKTALASKLVAEAEGLSSDPSGRLTRLAAARDLAAEAFNFSQAYQIVELMADTHEADTLEMRAGVLALAGRTAEAGETAKAVVEQALTLSDEARLALRYNEALSILRNAQVIARKSRDNTLLQTVTQRLDETTEERKLGS